MTASNAQTSEVLVPAELEPSPCVSNSENQQEISKFGWGGARPNSGGAREGAGRKPKPRPPALSEERWYCWKSVPKAVYSVWRELSREGFSAYVPVFVLSRDGTEETRRPMFGSHGFVAFNLATDPWRKVHSIPGIAHLFSSDPLRPIPVPRGIVEALQARGRPGDGVIDDLYQGPDFTSVAGQRVRITAGPFADLHGLCRWSNQKRVAVLLEVMGALVETEIRRSDVEAE